MNIGATNQSTRTALALARTPSQLGRLAAIGGLLAIIAGLFLYAGVWFTPHKLTPTSMVNTFENLNGVHPGLPRNHAKGVCVNGSFESNGNGKAISKALV
jgi:catalase